MSLRLRYLELRVQTQVGLFGARMKFSDGLVLLRADNTMGKSTCIQAIVYALGLEKMVSPSNAIPLPPAMTKTVEHGDQELPVLESEVLLEIENGHGEILAIQRGAKGERDPRLVRTWSGPRFSQPGGSFPQRDFYVRDPGAAQNEAGFGRRLAEFIGWQLPTVRRFNGSECPLYPEAIFPLFIVEQKHGWSGIQANLPTFFGIREMAKRCVEFVLKLDAARLAEERQALEQEQTELRNRWRNLTDVLVASLKATQGRVVGVPEQPSAQWPPAVEPQVEIFRGNVWVGAAAVMATMRSELNELEEMPVPSVGEAAGNAAKELDSTRAQLAERELIASELLGELQNENLEIRAIDSRVDSLTEDLRRNKDALKLKSFGSDAGWQIIQNVCPTCQQKLADTLLPQSTSENPMSIEDNIKFIQNQLHTFERLRENRVKLVARKEAEIESLRGELDTLRSRIRSLRETLIAPNSSPSIESVRQRIDLQSELRKLSRAEEEFHESMDSFRELAAAWGNMIARREALPADGFSESDKRKLRLLSGLLREQLQEFGFSSLPPSTLDISPETYRPTREGFDLGFDLSASDNIRMIWAYLEGLLELSHTQDTNHLGFLIFDEPRQQEAAELSFEKLLRRASAAGARNQQILFATSEPLSNLERLTQGLARQIITFGGRVISKLEP